MNVKALLLALPAGLLLLSPAFGQKSKADAPPPAPRKVIHIVVSESVLKMADWAGFKYREVLAASQEGNVSAIQKFLEFSGTVDGADALNHAVACLELIPAATDVAFSMAMVNFKPAFKKVLLDRLMLAQVRTKNIELRDSMTHWAPSTWSVLTGGAPICNCEHVMDGNDKQDAPAPNRLYLEGEKPGDGH